MSEQDKIKMLDEMLQHLYYEGGITGGSDGNCGMCKILYGYIHYGVQPVQWPVPTPDGILKQIADTTTPPTE